MNATLAESYRYCEKLPAARPAISILPSRVGAPERRAMRSMPLCVADD